MKLWSPQSNERTLILARFPISSVNISIYLAFSRHNLDPYAPSHPFSCSSLKNPTFVERYPPFLHHDTTAHDSATKKKRSGPTRERLERQARFRYWLDASILSASRTQRTLRLTCERPVAQRSGHALPDIVANASRLRRLIRALDGS